MFGIKPATFLISVVGVVGKLGEIIFETVVEKNPGEEYFSVAVTLQSFLKNGLFGFPISHHFCSVLVVVLDVMYSLTLSITLADEIPTILKSSIKDKKLL